MKKRKIFYFLKTKEEYDYMLSGGLIPRRGIVLIESTQEIYRDKKPYSGYGPLKTYFDELRTDLLSLILDKTGDVSSMVELINTKLQGDVNGYNELFGVKLTLLQNQINENSKSISDIVYYRDNTLIPSLKEIKDSTEDLSNKYNEVLQLVSKNGSTVNSFKSTLEELIDNISEFKSSYNSELTSIRNLITSLNTGGLTEVLTRNIIREMQLSDTDFASKVRFTVDPLLNALKNEITSFVNSRINEISGTGTGNNSSAIEYANSLFNKHANSIQYGTVMIGNYLKIDDSGKLTINTTSLKNVLLLSGGDNQSSSTVTNETINGIKLRLNVLESQINTGTLDNKITNIVNSKIESRDTLSVDWNSVYSSNEFNNAVKNTLRGLGIIDVNGNYNVSGQSSLSNSHFNIFESDEGYVKLSLTSTAQYHTSVELNNINGLIVLTYDGDIIEKRVVIGTPVSSLGTNRDFTISITEKILNSDYYNTYVGFTGVINGVVYKHGICVGQRNLDGNEYPLAPSDI